MSLIRFFTNLFASAPTAAKDLYPTEQNLYTFDKQTPELLIRSNNLLVQEAAISLQRHKQDMDKLIIPIIRYVAEYAMLLPASQSYHHKEAGSYFYHLLETANIAARSATDNPKLLFDVAMEHRNLYSRIYPLCAWIAGILHDIAKPLTDFQIIVYDKNRCPIKVKQLWQPDEETLFTYLVSYRAAYYRVLYLSDKQYTMHELQQMLFIKRFIEFFPAESQERLILKKILPLTLDKSSPIYQITKKADMESTRRDTLRLTPFPVLKNLSKAFVDTFQDFDRIYRISSDTNLPYYFSPIGIHIRYPDGMHSLIQQVQKKYSQLAKKPMPTDPDNWVQLLGTEHSLLIPNHASDIYHNARIPDISHYVYLVDVDLPTGRQQERVITLSYESVNLDSDKSSHYYQATFTTQQTARPPKITEEKVDPSPKVPKKKTLKKTVTPKSRKESAQLKPANDTEILPLFDNLPEAPLPIAKQQSTHTPAEQDDNGHVLAVAPPPNQAVTDSSPEGQLVAVAPPPADVELVKAPLISHGALNAMIMQGVESPIEQVCVNADHHSQDKHNVQNPHTLIDPYVAFLPPCKPQKTPSLTIQAMVNEIPSDHILMQWCNSTESMRNAYALQIKLLLLLHDVNQHDIGALLSNTLNYQITNKGFVVNRVYFDGLVKLVGGKLGWTMAIQAAISSQSLEQQSSDETRTAIFSSVRGRDRIFTQTLSQHLLHRYRGVLKPKIQLGEIVL